MVLRKTRHPRRYDGAAEAAEEESEPAHTRRDSGALRRRMLAGKGIARSDDGISNPSDDGRFLGEGRALKEMSRNRSGRLSDIPTPHLHETPVSRQETALNSPRATAEPTPNQSANGSVSGTSATQKVHRINTRSKGSARTSSSASSSDHEDLPVESLSQLSSSLKLAQSRASVLSANYSRLIRILLHDELDNLDREIAQVRNGTHKPLKLTWKTLEANRDAKKRIANAKLVAAEHEIDIRFGAQIDAEWQQFKNDKLKLRENMCAELASQITRLTNENDQARSLAVSVRPDSSLQQAPWWVKNPKQYTWLNLPDGVNDDQRDKDLARMGISPHSRHHNPSTIGLRTPSPEDAHRKRKRKHHHDHADRKRSRKEYHPDVNQRESEYMPPAQFEEDASMSLWTNPWSAVSRTRSTFGDGQPRLEDGGSEDMMTSLLNVVQDDMRYYMEPPPPTSSNWLSLPDASMPFKQHTPQVGRRFTHHAPLLPRPSAMPPEQFIETFYPQSPRRVSLPPPPPVPPSLLPLPRLMPAPPPPPEQNGLSLLSTESAGRTPEVMIFSPAIPGAPHAPQLTGPISPFESRKLSIIALREPKNDNIPIRPNEVSRERDEYFPPIQLTETFISPPTEPSHPSQSVPPLIEHRQTEAIPLVVPKAIAPRPISAPPPLPSPPIEPPKPTPIQPSPVIKSRSSSHSPDVQRNKRPLALLPKGMPPPSPPPPPPGPEPPAEDRTKYPLLRFNDKSSSSSSHVPPPPASMGRFGKIEPLPQRYAPYAANAKIAIPRHPSQLNENHVPLRIAPAPAKKVEGSVANNDEGGRGFVEIRRKSSGDQSGSREDSVTEKNMEEQEGKKIARYSGRPKRV